MNMAKFSFYVLLSKWEAHPADIYNCRTTRSLRRSSRAICPSLENFKSSLIHVLGFFSGMTFLISNLNLTMHNFQIFHASAISHFRQVQVKGMNIHHLNHTSSARQHTLSLVTSLPTRRFMRQAGGYTTVQALVTLSLAFSML
ncbi:hypothetical protein BLNAU_22325 [Blattamonas nauphoetae]|uniref:Uncharacterized protein n=1 Tax=Blattamonas nauphoetae TaxID=2049346 RepID=A0ABQ9WTD8_9EUKA|nr:hypothetical protein BLNAU_24969 [Blattamonas nauphoetae]KAK2942769.1 hypothetical protein BLNAU_22325 [Blattamonas nauphoetae]